MLVGIDFDNTIVCYDGLFHRLALEQKLIPADLLMTKSSVRDYLRAQDREPEWTELQGHVYGARMEEAPAYPGVIDFFDRSRQAQLDIRIISHKTKHPFLGPSYDLHAVAYQWLANRGFFDPAGINLQPAQVHFELTKQQKIERIRESGCSHFIDDLPEFLAEPDFPAQVERILFDPADIYASETAFRRVKSWTEIRNLLLD